MFILFFGSLYPLFSQLSTNNGASLSTPTHFSQKITISPAFMGPNALPVPNINTGIIAPYKQFEIAQHLHFGHGDRTQNLFAKLTYPFADEQIAVEAYMVPIEFFSMNDSIKAERNIPETDAKNHAVGDVCFGTIIQLLRDKKYLPDITLSMNCKTASGGNLEKARYTDTPGYWFDVAAGKTFRFNGNILDYVRIYGSGGFYCWQTYDTNPQNDAFLFGGGFSFQRAAHTVEISTGGYKGWKENGDFPIVSRIIFSRQYEQTVLKVGWQKGWRDFDYNTYSFSLIYRFHSPAPKPAKNNKTIHKKQVKIDVEDH